MNDLVDLPRILKRYNSQLARNTNDAFGFVAMSVRRDVGIRLHGDQHSLTGIIQVFMQVQIHAATRIRSSLLDQVLQKRIVENRNPRHSLDSTIKHSEFLGTAFRLKRHPVDRLWRLAATNLHRSESLSPR